MKTVTNVPDEFGATTQSLESRTILIVGADSDLGHSLGHYLALKGATLILQAKRRRSVSDLYDRIAATPGAEEPLIAEIDLDKATSTALQTLTDGLAANVAALDTVIYLPAPSTPLSPVLHCSDEHFQRALDEGVTQPARFFRATLPLLGQAPDPSVILQSIAAGRSGKPYWSANGAAAAGRENLVEALAAEHESIRFHTLDFGKTATALRHRAYPAEVRSTLRNCDDSLLLEMVLYLVSGQTCNPGRYTLPDLKI